MNTFSLSLQLYRVVVPVLAVLALAIPVGAHAASYTWGGQTFATEKEKNAYITEYVRVYKELYGTSGAAGKPVTSTAVKQTKVVSTQTSSGVTTRGADLITVKSARLAGSIGSSPTAGTNVWFMYGTNKNDLWFSTAPEALKSGFGSKSFDRKVDQLMHDTTYYYRAVVERNGVRSYGAVRSFTTLVDVYDRSSNVRVGWVGVEDVKDDRATFSAKPSFGKEGARATVWFEFGDEETDLHRKSPVRTLYRGDEGVEMTYIARNLDESTTYYVRVVGYDERGVKNYSAIRSFRTPVDIVGEKPQAETMRASDVAPYSATLNGEVSMNDFRNGTVFFVYGEDRNAILNVPKLYNKYSRIKTDGDALQKVLLDTDIDTEDAYSATVTSLDFDTTHYYAIGVEYEDDDGNEWIVLGRVNSFTTKSR